MLRAYCRYFLFVCIHKALVAFYCFQHGLFWRGLMHDISKFHPTEFIAHARYFFGDSRDQEALDRAWLHHLRRSPHHPEHWAIVQAGEGERAKHVRTREFRYVVIEMEEPYRTEMWCDWLARSRHRDKTDLGEWYERVGKLHPFGPQTRVWIEKKLKEL